jgi:hypothetical protein
MCPLCKRAALLVLLGLLGIPALTGDNDSARAAPVQVAQAAKVDVNHLSMEIMALQAIDQMHATPAQLQNLVKLAPETISKAKNRKPAKASDKYAKKLTEFRDALLKRDADDIQVVTGELGELFTMEKPVIDTTIEISEPARKRAPEFLKSLTPRQIALYLASVESAVPEPVDNMLAFLESSVKVDPKAWTEQRDGVAFEVGELVAGLDANASKKVAEKVAAVLDKGHKMNEADLKKNRAALEKEMHQIVDAAGPVEMLRHFMERHMAYLLSNSQLAVAANERLKKK